MKSFSILFFFVGITLFFCGFSLRPEFEEISDSKSRELFIHVIPIAIGAAHGAGHAAHVAVHVALAKAATAKALAGKLTIKFKNKCLRYELEDVIYEESYEQLCSLLIDKATNGNNEEFAGVEDILVEAFGLKPQDITRESVKNLACQPPDNDENCVCGETCGKEHYAGCISGESPISVPGGGYILAKDLKLGDSVLTSFGVEPVLAIIEHPGVVNISMIEVDLGFDVIQATFDHYIYLDSGEEVRFDSLEVGQELMGPSGITATKIKSVRVTTVNTMLSPVTPSCTYLINNVVVSCTTSSSPTSGFIRFIMPFVWLLHSILPVGMYKIGHDYLFQPLFHTLFAFIYKNYPVLFLCSCVCMFQQTYIIQAPQKKL